MTITNRRQFLKRAAGATAGFMIVPRHVLGGTGYTPPSDQLTKAIVGVGGMGRGHIPYEGTRLLAVCDVDRKHLDEVLAMVGKDVKGYSDYREVLQRQDVDIVHIATPPHWHALISVEAARAGKDIWCEKPMTRTIAEGMRVIEEVNRHGRIFRLNTWFRFKDTFYGLGTDVKPLKKVIQSGVLGWPLTFTVSGVTGYDWKFYWSGRTDLKPQPVPQELDYEMWLGPAPYKPYNPERVHAEVPRLLGLRRRRPGRHGAALPRPGAVPARQGRHQPDPRGRRLPAAALRRGRLLAPHRIHVRRRLQDRAGRREQGHRGGLHLRAEGQDLPRLPIRHPEPPADRSPHAGPGAADRDLLGRRPLQEEVRAQRDRTGTAPSTLVNLGVIAVRLGRTLHYDPVAQRCKDDEAANRLVEQPLRAPWVI